MLVSNTQVVENCISFILIGHSWLGAYYHIACFFSKWKESQLLSIFDFVSLTKIQQMDQEFSSHMWNVWIKANDFPWTVIVYLLKRS